MENSVVCSPEQTETVHIFMEYQSSRRNCALVKRYCEIFTVPSKSDKLMELNYNYMYS